jgi:hypothetical protein
MRASPSPWIRLALAALVLAGFGYGAWRATQSRQDQGHEGPGATARTSGAAPAAEPRSPRSPQQALNRLAGEASPYLQLHARNPVDWYPWGDEALARARAEDKPIFLSIGYSTCYWCHVMEREVFSNPEIAAAMNAHFVSIKVDREERPDLDAIYMEATKLLTGSAGWPNSLFLTPDGLPFLAGTYFPPQDEPGRPGFPGVLRSIREAWSSDRARVLAVADQVAQRIQGLADLGGGTPGALPPAPELLRQAVDELAGDYDPDHGGFGSRTKFPRPPALELLLAALERERDPKVEAMLTKTLDEMALGGMYDQLAGGFHRYSTERTWSIPHFEKMLYDNAQLVGIYARAYALLGRPLYRRVVEQTVAYLDREMSHPEGGFASAQDAEVDGEEGASYVWSRSEIERRLGPERASAFLSFYELTPMREKPALGVLRVRFPVKPALQRTAAADVPALLARFDGERAALLARRAEFPQPLRDDKVLAAWNGLAIRGLTHAAEDLGRPDYVARAERVADFVLGRLRTEDGSLRRSYIAGQARERGVLDDYAFLADGLLGLQEATGDGRWLARARSLADLMLESFEDPAGGGFFLTPEGSSLLIRPKLFEDNEIPSGNAVALRVLRTLAAETAADRYRTAAARTATAAAPLLRRAPSALAATVAAMASEPEPSRTVAASRAGSEAAAEPGSRLPRSEDHVRASLAEAAGDSSRFAVRLAIDDGWHVNANPASMPFLVPTQVELRGGSAAEIHYPEGRAFRPAFVPEAIRVYEGTVEIELVMAPGSASPSRVALRFQACDERMCLPPARTELALEGKGERTLEAGP